jgi:hypothetical protein
MKKIIFTTTIILLLVSCTVTKQTKSDYSLMQQVNEINRLTNPQTGQVTQTGAQESKTEEVTSTATTKMQEKSNYHTPDKKAILEKLNSELIPQTKNKDYNPYKYAREEFILSCLEVRISYETTDYCENGKKLIEKFYEVDLIASDKEKCEFISDISLHQCQETYEFLETQIKNNSSEKVRCDAIVLLAWSLNLDYLPCILEYAKRDSLTIQEKLALGGAFMIYGVYTTNSELKEKSVKFLDGVCYEDPSLETYAYCDACYLKLGGKAALDFYTSRFEQQEKFERLSAAVALAKLGEYDKTFPIFEEAISSGTGINAALYGLAAIGTEEAFQLIKEQTRNKNEMIAKTAKRILQYIDIERRDK